MSVDGRNTEKIEEVNVGFMQQVTGMKAQRMGYKTWKKERAARVIQASEIKPIW